MISSILIEQKVVAFFVFLSIETGLFRVERALPTPGKRQCANLDPPDCFLVSEHHWQVPFNLDQSRVDG